MNTIDTLLMEAERPLNTREILDHINTTTRHGSTMHQLGNVLAKNKCFVEWGNEFVRGIISGRYEILTWVHEDRVGEFSMKDRTSTNVPVLVERDDGRVCEGMRSGGRIATRCGSIAKGISEATKVFKTVGGAGEVVDCPDCIAVQELQEDVKP